jgi:hypothetical protein
MQPFLSSSLNLAQVFTWILERHVLVSDDMLLSHRKRELIQRLVWLFIPKRVSVDLSGLGTINFKNAPPHDKHLHKYLTESGNGPSQLSDLKPENVAYFVERMLACLEQWYRKQGRAEDQVGVLAQAGLREIDEWLENNGVRADLVEIAERVFEARVAAQNRWIEALAQLFAELESDCVHATGRRNGIGDPEPIPAYFWPLLTFEERNIKRRGLLTCACYEADPMGDFWSDLRIDSANVATVWPRATTPASTPEREPTLPPVVVDGGKKRRQGPKPEKFMQARDAMLADLQSGKVMPANLEAMADKTLQDKYGVFPRDTANKARKPFSRDTVNKARDAALSQFNYRQTPTNDK